MKMGMGIRGGY